MVALVADDTFVVAAAAVAVVVTVVGPYLGDINVSVRLRFVRYSDSYKKVAAKRPGLLPVKPSPGTETKHWYRFLRSDEA